MTCTQSLLQVCLTLITVEIDNVLQETYASRRWRLDALCCRSLWAKTLDSNGVVLLPCCPVPLQDLAGLVSQAG